MTLNRQQDEIGSQRAWRDPSLNAMSPAGVEEQRVGHRFVRCPLGREDIAVWLFERGIQDDGLFAQRDRDRSSGRMDLGGCNLVMFQCDGFMECETGAIEQPPHKLIADREF